MEMVLWLEKTKQKIQILCLLVAIYLDKGVVFACQHSLAAFPHTIKKKASGPN